jgi:tetratricopeptide (TPR) repeat protein
MKKLFNLFLICFFLSGCAAQMQASKGWNLLDKGNPDEAIKAFEASKEKKELPGYYLGMYHSYIEKKDIKNAEKYISLGVEKFPSDFHLNYAYGYFLLKVKDNSREAIKYFEKCRELNPGSARDLLEEAILEANGSIK